MLLSINLNLIYVSALAAPNTVNTMPEETLLAFGNHGQVDRTMPRDGSDSEQVLVAITRAGVDVEALAKELQDEGAKGFVDLLEGSAQCNRYQEQGAKLIHLSLRKRRSNPHQDCFAHPR